MSILSDLREELAGMLEGAGITTFDFIPERVSPPAAVIAAGEPYVEEVFDAKTFNHDYRVRMEVTLIAGQAANDTATDVLDDLICKALVVLEGSWETEISQPYQLLMNNATYLSAKATISTTITIQ